MTQTSIKKNTIYSAIKTVSSIAFPLITFPYINRVLQPENVGKVNFGLSIVSYFSLIASLGISTYAIRECSAVRTDKEKLSNLASQIFSINIVMTVIAYCALAITLLLYRKLDNYRSLIIIQSLSILATTLGADWLNSAMEDFKYISIRSVGFQIISLALMFIFVRKPQDYMKYVIISLVSSAGASIVNIWYRRKYCKVGFVRNFQREIEWNKHMKPIMLLFVMILAQTIFNSVDSTMLGIIHGDREVGIYTTAHRISNIITQLITSLLWVIMPRMSYFFAKGDYTQINSLLRKVLGFNALFGLPCAAGAFVLSDEIILILAGSEYGESSAVLKILMIGFAFTLFGGSFLGNSVLLPAKKEKSFMIVCCAAAVINVITNYLFIPKYGAIAAAGTTALCAAMILFMLLFSVDKKIKIERIGKLFYVPILGCAFIVMVCLACRAIQSLWLRTILSITLATLIYFAVMYFGKNEIMVEFVNDIEKRILRRQHD